MPGMFAMVVLALVQVQAQAIDAGAPADAGPRPADASAEPPSGEAVVKPPALKRFVPAVYPPEAEAAGIAGSVTLSIVIDETGKVGEVKVLDPGPHPGFAPAAVAAVKQFGFSPAEIAGKRAAVEISYRYEFVLKRAPPPPVPKDKPLALEGRIIERGTRSPVVAASIDADGVTAETDTDGRFNLRGLPVGPVRIRVVSPAHNDLLVDEIIEPGKVKEVEYRMNRRRYGSFEAVVRGERERREVAVHEVSTNEITTVPGTQGDVLKGIQ